MTSADTKETNNEENEKDNAEHGTGSYIEGKYSSLLYIPFIR